MAWLYITFPEVLKYKSLSSLKNEDKRELEDRSQNEANNFWEWLKENFPDYIWNKRVFEIKQKMTDYCFENDIDIYYFNKYFWNNSKYPKKNIRFWDKVFLWVTIE